MSVENNIEFFFDYWRSICDGNLVPRKAAFDPAAVPYLLPNISILEYFSETKLIYRLQGTARAGATEQDRTGNNLLDFPQPDMQRTVADRLRAVVQQPCGLYSEYGVKYAISGVQRTATLFLPLANDEGTVRFIIDWTDLMEPHFRQARMVPDIDEMLFGPTELFVVDYRDIGAGIPNFK